MSKVAVGNLALATRETVPESTVGRFITYTSSFPPPSQGRESGFFPVIKTQNEKKDSLPPPCSEGRSSVFMHTLASIGHDQNNALVLVFGALDLMETSPDCGPETKAHIEQAREAANRLKELGAQLMNVVHMGLPSHKTPLVFETRLRKIVDLCVMNSDVRVVYNLQENHWPILIDADVFAQIIQNLAMNARQAMPQGGQLTISARNRIENGKNKVMIRIEDQGHGIDPDNLERLFSQPFSTKPAGHGIGLSFIRLAVEGCGGKIDVSSKVGHGTDFTLTLPAVPNAA